jgi:hypothetical protein
MLGDTVEIFYDGNFYDSMVGKVIDEGEHHVLVKIDFSLRTSHAVVFYKDQVQIYNEN